MRSSANSNSLFPRKSPAELTLVRFTWAFVHFWHTTSLSIMTGESMDARNVSPACAVLESTESIIKTVIAVPAGTITSLTSTTGIGAGAGVTGCGETAGGAELTGTRSGSGGAGDGTRGAGVCGETLPTAAAFFASFLRGFSAGLAAGGGIGVAAAGVGSVAVLTSDVVFSAAADFVSDGVVVEHAETNKPERTSGKYNLRK